MTDSAADLLAQQGFDPDYGARPLRRAIRTGVEDQLAQRLLSGDLKAGDSVTLLAQDGALALQDSTTAGKKR